MTTTPVVATRIAITFSTVSSSPRKTKPKIAVWIASVFRYAVVTTKERSFIARSIMPVPTIWHSAPSRSHGQNAGAGHGAWSPDAISTVAKNSTENGKPNRKRILVAPQVPSGPVSDRCIALRATCPAAATSVKGIQSVATEDMKGPAEMGVHRAGRVSPGQLALWLIVLHPSRLNHTVVPAKAGTHNHSEWFGEDWLPRINHRTYR